MRLRIAPRPLLGLAAAFAIAAIATPALATDPVPANLTGRDGHAIAALDLGAALPADLATRLGNGLQNVLAIFVGVVPAGADEPTAGIARVLEILFDVWEETWTVTIRDAQSPGGRRTVVATAAELRRILAHGADADLGPAAQLPATFSLVVRIDVNPVSPELLARTREYLAGAAGRPGGTSRSVLGAVAGFLLRQPDDEGEVLLLRSSPLSRDAAKAR